MSNVQDIVAAFGDFLPEGAVYPLHEPNLGAEEEALIADCVKSGWVSSVGAYVDQFEADLAAYTGANHAIVTTNGTSALHLSYLLAGIQTGDEVLCPSLTFVATPNAVTYCGAIPHFVEVDETRLSVCPVKLRSHLETVAKTENGQLFNKETKRPIRALVVMHTFGHPADLDALKIVCDEFNIALIEDAAESLGSFYKGTHTGNHGIASAISFNGNKIISTGGGGAVLTNDATLAARAKHLSTTAKTPHPYEYHHEEVAFNYRLPNLNAAMGVAQLRKLPGFLTKKRAIVKQYQTMLDGLEGVSLILQPDDSESNYWLNTLRVSDATVKTELLESLIGRDIFARPIWKPMHLLLAFTDCPRADMTTTNRCYDTLVSLPSSVSLADYC